MKLCEYVAQRVEELGEELGDEAATLLQHAIKFDVRPRPTAEDLARGCSADDRAYFYGHPVRGEDDDDAIDENGEGGAVFYADDSDDVAHAAEHKPGGVIVLFTENIGRPLTPEKVEAVLLHEIAHFLGEDEEGVFELGLHE